MHYNFANFNEGFAAGSQQDVQELNKALEAGAGYAGPPGQLTGGGALQVESLDASLKSVTYDLKNLVLWPSIAKDQAYNTIEEYNRVQAYGDQGRGFINEGALPRSEDSSYTRELERVRFIGVTRELTHVYTLVRNAHGDAIAREIASGTRRILEITERSLFEGHAHYSNAGKFDGQATILEENNGDVAWNGLDRQIRSGDQDASARATAFEGYEGLPSSIGDQRGSVLDEDSLEDAATAIMENFGQPTAMIMDPKSHRDLNKQFFPKERINPMGVQNGRAGFVLREFDSSAGAFSLMSDVFISPKTGVQLVADVPATPAAPTATAAAGTADSKWSAAEAGDYTYRVSAVNQNGESALSPSSAAATVAADGSVSVAIAAVAGAFAYAVYRSAKDADADHKFIGFVAPAAIGGVATLVDLNHKLPGTSQAYLLSNNSESVRFKQLAPLMKFNLATVATAMRWAQLLYGTPIVYAPKHHFIFENIGRAA